MKPMPVKVIEGDSINRNETTALPSYRSQSRKRKIDENDEFQEDIMNILKTPDDRHLCFFLRGFYHL